MGISSEAVSNRCPVGRAEQAGSFARLELSVQSSWICVNDNRRCRCRLRQAAWPPRRCADVRDNWCCSSVIELLDQTVPAPQSGPLSVTASTHSPSGHDGREAHSSQASRATVLYRREPFAVAEVVVGGRSDCQPGAPIKPASKRLHRAKKEVMHQRTDEKRPSNAAAQNTMPGGICMVAPPVT